MLVCATEVHATEGTDFSRRRVQVPTAADSYADPGYGATRVARTAASSKDNQLASPLGLHLHNPRKAARIPARSDHNRVSTAQCTTRIYSTQYYKQFHVQYSVQYSVQPYSNIVIL